MTLERQEEETSRRLARGVHRRLEDMIFSGTLRSGDVITERRLAQALDVSRTPLRDALLMLEGQGLLKRRGPRYLEVREMTVPEYMQVLNIRRLLEPEAARLCVPRIDKALVASLHGQVEAMLDASAASEARPDAQEPLRLDMAIHEGIADASGNPMMAGMIRDLRRRTRIFDLGRMPDRFVAVCQEHLAILSAIAAGDAAEAGAAMTRHIDAFKGSIIRHLSSI